ncbi:MAG: VTC domain-containing protein [Methanospirillum sp.]
MIRASEPERKWRYERKYPQEIYSLAEVELLVRLHPALFIEAHPPRWVNSLYFDTPTLGGLADSVDGQRDRVKVRIRWYGEMKRRIKSPAIEFKRKRGRLGSKDRYDLAPIDFKNGIAPSQENLEGRPPLPDDIQSALRLLVPVSLVRYRRLYYLSADRRFRLTVDADLSFYRVLPGSRRLVRLPDTFRGTVVEVKYGSDDDEAARPVLEALPFRWSRFSKYCAAFEEV